MSSMPGMGAPTMAVMMVAMMLPSVAPALWCYYRTLRSSKIGSAGWRTILLAGGYAGVWMTIGVALSELGAALAPMSMAMTSTMRLAPCMAGLLIAGAGVVQRSSWKAKYLVHCHPASIVNLARRGELTAAWRDGLRLGIHCSSSCAPIMAALFVAGLMDTRGMAVTMLAITAERLAPSGARVARFTGSLALGAGLAMSVQAIVLAR